MRTSNRNRGQIVRDRRPSCERLEERRLMSAYTLADLGALGVPGTAYELNDHGQIAGVAAGRAFRWEAGAVTDLGNLGGPVSRVTGMNNLGHVIGLSAPADGAPAVPFRWKDGVIADLGLGAGATVSAINDSGQIVGSTTAGRAFLWQDGVVTDLGELVAGGGASAVDINNAGQATGSAYTGEAGDLGIPFLAAFRWEDGVMTRVGGNYPNAINNLGQVAGSTPVYINTGYGAAFVSKSFFYDGTTTIHLPVPSLQNLATDVNDAGQVVGNMNGRAYLYEGGVVKDLNTLVAPGMPVIAGATAINNAGQIMASGSGRAFLLTPESAAPAGQEVQVWVGGTEIAGGAAVAFGETPTGVAVTRTFSVRNVGSQALTLAGPIALPAGFTLASDFSATSLAPGGVATFTVRLDATAAGGFGGDVSFGTNDADEGTFRVAVSGAVLPVRVIDDGAAGFGVSGRPPAVLSQGYQGDARRLYLPASRLLRTARLLPRVYSAATWTFAGVAPGTYRVSATWTAGPDRASNARYTVTSGTTPSTGVTVNQRGAPDDFTAHGVPWENLGTFTAAGGTLSVRLTNQVNGRVIADAARLERVDSPAAAASAPVPVESRQRPLSRQGVYETLVG